RRPRRPAPCPGPSYARLLREPPSQRPYRPAACARGVPASTISLSCWFCLALGFPGSSSPQSAEAATTTSLREGIITQQLPRTPRDITVSAGASGQVSALG